MKNTRAADIIKSLLSEAKKGEKLILISVPHAFGSKKTRDNNHPSDVAAPRVAKAVQDLLEEAGIKSSILFGDKPRSEVDYNRKEGRETKWRESLSELMTGASLLLDIHSYPEDAGAFGEHDMVLFKNYIEKSLYDHYLSGLERLLDVLAYECPKETDPDGSEHSHDIIEDAAEKGVPAILLEVNEKFMGDISGPAEAIADATISWIGGSNEKD